MTIEAFKKHYENRTGNSISGSGSGSCHCPAHEDRTASLSISEGDDGRILLYCHAGCKTEDVVAALGLTMADLRPDAGRNGCAPSPKGQGGNKVHPDMSAAAQAALWSIQQQEDKKGATLEHIWEYHNAVGEVYAAVARINLSTPDGERRRKEFRPLRKVTGGWQVGDPDRWLPYHVETVKDSATVHLVEGEKCADALARLGFITVTSAHGAKSPRKTDWKTLAGKMVYLWPDNDDAGRQYVETVAGELADQGCKLYLMDLSDLPKHGDVADWMAGRPQNETNEEKKAALDNIIAAAMEYTPPVRADVSPAAEKEAHAGPNGKPSNHNAAETLIALAQEEGHEFFHDADGVTYVSFWSENAKDTRPGKHRETWPVDSRSYKQHLAGRYYSQHKKAPNDSAITDAVNTMEHRASAGERRTVGVRRIHGDGKIYLDLADETWTTVETDAAGWRICPDPPVRFLRKKGMLPLPMPEQGGNIDDLRPLVNVPDENQWILIKAWLLSVFNGDIPLPILAVHGEQGSAKSTLCRLLRMLVDPNKAALRTFPKDERDLIISANNNLILAFDNLSGLPPAMADAVCRLSTGAGYAIRALYSDDEENIFAGRRSIIINGIEDLAGRADLLDRCITIQLPAIPDDERKNEADL